MFKFLEIVSNKDDKRGGGGGSSSSSAMAGCDATLRRNVSNPTHSLKLNGSHGNSISLQHQRKKQSFDGTTTTNGRSMEHIDKQWSEEAMASPKWSPMHSSASTRSSANTSESATPVNGGTPNLSDLSPVDEKAGGIAPLSNMQTYREYKEALRQQRNQDSTAVYRSKENTSSSGSSCGGSNQASPMSPVNGNKSLTGGGDAADVITIKPKVMISGGGQRSEAEKESGDVELDNNSKNNNNNKNKSNNIEGGYVKPASPMGAVENAAKNGTGKSVGGSDSTDSLVIKSIMNGNMKRDTGKMSASSGDTNGKTGGVGGGSIAGGTSSAGAKNPKRTVSWNRDIVTPEKNISFTMRREFDRHKEEAELTGKLRNVSIGPRRLSLLNWEIIAR